MHSQRHSRSIWTVYMRLPPTPPRPICMSCAAVANGALGRTSPITTLPLFHTYKLNKVIPSKGLAFIQLESLTRGRHVIA